MKSMSAAINAIDNDEMGMELNAMGKDLTSLKAEVKSLHAKLDELADHKHAPTTQTPTAPIIIREPINTTSPLTSGSQTVGISNSYETVRIGYGKVSIYFDTNSALIKDSELSKVSDIAAILNQYPEAKLSVRGFADKQGDADYNLKLSKRRAESVKFKLTTSYAVSPTKVLLNFFGESSDSDQQKDPVARRVEIELVK